MRVFVLRANIINIPYTEYVVVEIAGQL